MQAFNVAPVVDRLVSNLYSNPWASDGRINGVFQPAWKTSKSVALSKPIIQINGPRCIRYLSFDIDRKLGALGWEGTHLPPPNLMIVNPDNGHAHLVWELAKPVWLPKAGKKHPCVAPPIRYMKAVEKAMARALKADPDYRGLLVKNPTHPSWATSCGATRPYELKELARNLDLDTTQTASIRENPQGRNCTLFDSVGIWARSAKRNFFDFDEFRSAIDEQLDMMNQTLPFPLPHNEVCGIGKSVARYVWRHHFKKRGIMGLDPQLDLRVRQQKGQTYTCHQRTERTLLRIKKALSTLREAGLPISKSAVAGQAKLHRSTVGRYWGICCFDSLKFSNDSNVKFSNDSTVKPNDDSTDKPNSTSRQERKQERETVSSLQDDESQGSLCSPGGSAPTESIPETPNATPILSYQQAMDQYQGDRFFKMAKAAYYAMEQAQRGILIPGVSPMLKSALISTIDRSRQRETTNEPTTH